MTQGKNREIRRIMQKHSLRVNRLKRLSYGPYTLFDLTPGELRETEILPQIKNLLYLAQRNKVKEKEESKEKVEDVKLRALQGVDRTKKRMDNRGHKLEARRKELRTIEQKKDPKSLPQEVKAFSGGFNLRKDKKKFIKKK